MLIRVTEHILKSKNNNSEHKVGSHFNLRRISSDHYFNPVKFLIFATCFILSFSSNMTNFSTFSFLYSFHFQISFQLLYLRLCIFFLFPSFCALLMHSQLQSHYISISFSNSLHNIRQVLRLALQRTTCDECLT